MKCIYVFFRLLFYTVGQHDITKALLQQENKGFRVLYNNAVIDGYTELLLNTLDTGIDVFSHSNFSSAGYHFEDNFQYIICLRLDKKNLS
jgi:hypothetical protein